MQFVACHPFRAAACLQAAFLLALAGQGLSAWGAGPGSPLRPDAMTYLTIRALGAPATVLFMVAQAGACISYALVWWCGWLAGRPDWPVRSTTHCTQNPGFWWHIADE